MRTSGITSSSLALLVLRMLLKFLGDERGDSPLRVFTPGFLHCFYDIIMVIFTYMYMYLLPPPTYSLLINNTHTLGEGGVVGKM